MRKALHGVRWLVDRWSMRRYQRGRIRDARRDEQGAENLQRTREGIYPRGEGGGF